MHLDAHTRSAHELSGLAVLVGHDRGGALALDLAARHPERVRGLVVLETILQAPFPDPASRRPMLMWPREIPIDGEPADRVAVVERYGAWLASSPATPKLVLTFDGAGRPPRPAEIGDAIDAWLAQKQIGSDASSRRRASSQ